MGGGGEGGGRGGSGGGAGEQLQMRSDGWHGADVRWVHRQSRTAESCGRLTKCDSHVLWSAATWALVQSASAEMEIVSDRPMSPAQVSQLYSDTPRSQPVADQWHIP